MTKISDEDVLYLAQLSKIELDKSEISNLKNDLVNILNYVNQLDKLDTEGVEPTYQVTGLENVWRQDEVINYQVTREELLARAPESSNNQVKVPKVL